MAQSMLSPGLMVFSRYEVHSLIATGGYASVYRVTDVVSGQPRAMKEVVDTDEGIREQFRLEATLLITSRHPNIPRGYDHFSDLGRAYLIMDYVEGQDLEQILSDHLARTGQPLPEEQVLRWMLPILDALDEMHRQMVPIIHRDIKPANIKLTADGTPILIDFGLAKRAVFGPTQAAALGVTPGYAPPEQYLAAGRTDARTDIYGVGATLYTLLTGHEPVEAPSRLLAQSGKSGEPLVPARFYNSTISAATAHIIDRAMDVGASMRHQSASELRRDLEAAVSQLAYGRPYVAEGETTVKLAPGLDPVVNSRPPPARETPPPPPPAQMLRRQRAAAVAARRTSGEAPWFDLGGPVIRRLGKFAIFLSAFEIYWGLLIVAGLTSVIGTGGFTRPPSTLVTGIAVVWVLVVVMITVVLVRALDRPIARRGRISTWRRWLQAIALLVIWSGMNIIAALYFSQLANELPLIALGLLSLASILNGLLSAANVLA